MSSTGKDQAGNPSLTLCLSGGGLRATLFHLGVIKALRGARIDGKPAIFNVKDIYSVSGGSIIAAHLFVNWEKYCGNEKDFESAADEIRQLAARDIRARVLQRWVLSIITLIPWLKGGGRGFWLAKEYEHLYGKKHLARLYRNNDASRPKLHVLATSMQTGELCSFSSGGFEVISRSGNTSMASLVEAPADLIPLPFAVAASSAFPPMFPPLQLTGQMLGGIDPSILHTPLYLSDGGVFDNLGVEKLMYDKSTGRNKAGVVVLSNAGSSFRSDARSKFSGIFSRNIRATDIMMRRIAESTDERISRFSDAKVIDLRIKDTADDSPMSLTTQHRMKGVRTDLNHFSSLLTEMLVEHGYQIGKKGLNSQGISGEEQSVSHPIFAADPELLDREAEEASRRSVFRFNFRDWTTYVLMLIFSLSIGLIVQAGFSYYNAKVVAQDKTDDSDAASEQSSARIADLERRNAELIDRLAVYENSAKPTALPFNDYRIWIQFAGAIKREEMIEFGQSIKRQWPDVPGADRGGERTKAAFNKNEVRYGPVSDEPAAKKLAEHINYLGKFPHVKIAHTPSISPGSLEIWVSR